MGHAVGDGFYNSMTALKKCDMEQLKADPNLSPKFTNYDNIIKICQDKPPIPPISLAQSAEIKTKCK